jgi:hypothetical protein
MIYFHGVFVLDDGAKSGTSNVLDHHMALRSALQHPFSFTFFPLLAASSSHREHHKLEWFSKALIPPLKQHKLVKKNLQLAATM